MKRGATELIRWIRTAQNVESGVAMLDLGVAVRDVGGLRTRLSTLTAR